jgi:hypothetical protein
MFQKSEHPSQVLNTALMEFLQQSLGPLMTRPASAAWQKFLDALVIVIKSEVMRIEGQGPILRNLDFGRQVFGQIFTSFWTNFYKFSDRLLPLNSGNVFIQKLQTQHIHMRLFCNKFLFLML